MDQVYSLLIICNFSFVKWQQVTIILCGLISQIGWVATTNLGKYHGSTYKPKIHYLSLLEKVSVTRGKWFNWPYNLSISEVPFFIYFSILCNRDWRWSLGLDDMVRGAPSQGPKGEPFKFRDRIEKRFLNVFFLNLSNRTVSSNGWFLFS